MSNPQFDTAAISDICAAATQTYNHLSAKADNAASLPEFQRVAELLRGVFPLVCAIGAAEHFGELAELVAENAKRRYKETDRLGKTVWRAIHKDLTKLARSYRGRAEDTWK